MAKASETPVAEAEFIEPMECLAAERIPEGTRWTYEIKLDGYRMEVVRAGGFVTLFSRNAKVMTQQFPQVAAELKSLPDGTVLDGELCALDEDGKPSFGLLQNYRSKKPKIVFFAFDILILRNRSLMRLPLSERGEHLRKTLKPSEHVQIAERVSSAGQMMKFVREYGLEGVVAKRADSWYWPGKHNDCWIKHRVNIGQEFVIGGYRPSYLGIESLLVGYYRGANLCYAGRVRAGFVPVSRREVHKQIRHLATPACPFVNLPDKSKGSFGEGITAKEMGQFIWLRPEAVAQIEFVEWTPNRLRHSKFIGLRTDKDPQRVVKEK
jgi:bifunctional non-homologous end joining protein LigD